MAIPSKPTYTHGSTGDAPNSALDYANGDPVDQAHMDYYVNTPLEKIKSIIDVLNALDNNDDGVVDEADSANLYKGNEIDLNADGVVDEADTANLYKGNDIDDDGDGKVNEAEDADDATNVTSTYKGQDIDTNGDGKVDIADQADNAALISGKRVTVSDTEPTNRNDNDIWIDMS